MQQYNTYKLQFLHPQVDRAVLAFQKEMLCHILSMKERIFANTETCRYLLGNYFLCEIGERTGTLMEVPGL